MEDIIITNNIILFHALENMQIISIISNMEYTILC
jgi:hypothetical protein